MQFDDRTERERRIQPQELNKMIQSGWIRQVSAPRLEQRLDRYELTEDGRILLQTHSRKTARRESEITEPIRLQKRA
jgi:DNA-binding PadR family transcriptional regulator